MQTPAIQPEPAAASAWSPQGRLFESQRSFATALGKATAPVGPPLSPEARAREAAEGLVTQTFIVPLLKQLRESNKAAPPFAPTQAERQFRALADAELAQRIVRATRFPLVDRLAQDLLKRGGKDIQGRPAAAQIAPPAPPPGNGVNFRGIAR